MDNYDRDVSVKSYVIPKRGVVPTQSVRLLFVGDIHADERTPTSRKDDYLVAILTKLREIAQIAKEKKVDGIIFLGDIFNRMEVSGKCRNAIISLLMGINNNIKLYTVIGNHDVKSTVHNIPNSAIGTLIETGVVSYLHEIPEWSIGFGHYTPQIELALSEGQYEDQDNTIMVFHANIADIPMMFEHVLFEDVKVHANCKLVVGGHLHRKMTSKNNDGVIFVNPGSICRNELSEYHMNHSPEVYYVEYIPNGEIVASEFIPLESVVPAKDIFRIEEAQTKKDDKIDIRNFILQITSMNTWNTNDDKYTSLRNAGEIKQIESEVVELVIKAIQEVNSGEK